MAKERQERLFAREVPQMPEGYYSSGPNPNLRRFVEEHATPYDPETDDYDVPPFDQPIKTTKATAIYNMHTYWSKKPHDAIRQYIGHYTEPGDIVLDPFCGSGSTALAALMEGRAAIAIDLSPAATFITKNYCTPVDVDALQAAFRRLERAVKPEIDWLYETRCDRCGGRATTSYTVYSQRYQCPSCLEIVALFDCPEVPKRDENGEIVYGRNGKPRTIKVCPHCHAREHDEEISTRSQRHGAVPVLVSYQCQEGCTPKRNERRHNDPDPRKRDYFERYDLAKIAEIEGMDIPHWTPGIPMIKGYETTVKRNLEAQGVHLVDDLFTKRNLWALAALLSAAGTDEQLRLFVQSSLMACSKRAQYPAGGYITGNYYLPPVFAERNVLQVVGRIGAKTIKAKGSITKSVISTDLLISTESATELAAIPDATVDHVFTDPPYGGSVQFGELNFVWEAWMGFDTKWVQHEIVVNEVRGLTEEDWACMMLTAMSECYRVLKPNRALSLCYHDTSEGTWQLVQDIMTEVGFIPEHMAGVLSIDTGGHSYNQYTANKVTKRDLVINFRKPRPGELDGLALTGEEDPRTFRQIATAILRQALEAHPGSTADRLYDELVSRTVRKGQFERHDFDELLRAVAEPVREPVKENLFDDRDPDLFGTHVVERWYLKETADTQDQADAALNDAAADRLETAMRDYLQENPGEEGVHYSDLFEWYLPIQPKPRAQLADWLPEYYFRTSEGTWRPPRNDEERQQKAALRATGTLRRIKRYANALLEDVPPAERDKPGNVATAADWLRQCRRAGLYAQGRALYERGGHAFASLDEAAQLQVDEDYRLCVRRSEA